MIPKKIHYIWLGNKEEPEILKKCKQSWKKYCPDYEIIRWDESNLDLSKYQFAMDAYSNNKFAFASDVFRFDILNREGGIYLDVDVELIKPLDEFLKYDLFMGFEDKENLNPGLIIGSKKENLELDNLISIYKTTKFDVQSLQQQTICVITTEYFEKNYGLKRDNSLQKFANGEIAVFPSEYFCPKSMVDGKIRKTQNTISIHWYNMSWYTPAQRFKHNCKVVLNVLTFGLFEKLLKKIRK